MDNRPGFRGSFRIVGPSRVIVNSNGVSHYRAFADPQFRRSPGPYTQYALPGGGQPLRQIVVRRSGVAGSAYNIREQHVVRSQLPPYRSSPSSSSKPLPPSIVRDYYPRVSTAASQEDIDVGLLAQYSENAIRDCKITINAQIWFEAIMMTFGENMSVLDAASKINLDLMLLLRLVNIVRESMDMPHLTSTRHRQFEYEIMAGDTPPKRQFTVRRVVRVVPRQEVPPIPEPSASPDERVSSPVKSSEVLMPKKSPSVPKEDEQPDEYWTESTGKEAMREALEQVKGNTVSEDEARAAVEADAKMRDNEESLALELASIATMRTVLREEKRTDFTGSHEDLEKYFHQLLLEHKQDISPSTIRALTLFVAKKNSNFHTIVSVEGVNRKMMRTILRLALFEKRLETTEIPSSDDEMEVKHSESDEEMDTSEKWLRSTVAELSVPISVSNLSIVLNLAETKMDRACLKALYRHVASLVENDVQMRIAVERLVMDGYNVASGVPEDVFEFWSARMERMLMCLLREYPVYLARWRSMAKARLSQEAAVESGKRRESSRIKARESTVPDSLYLDRIFSRDLKKSFITFLKKMKSSGLPMSESTVVSIGEKILSLFDGKRSVERESWSDWINLVLGVESNSLFEYLHNDD